MARYPHLFAPAICLSASLAAVHGAEALTITTNTGTDGISGQLDFDDGYGGGGGWWHVKNSGATSNTTRKGLMRFDISSITDTVADATFNLTVERIDSGIGGNDQTLHIFGLTDQSLDNWDSGATTWNNAPGNATGSAWDADGTKTVKLGEILLDYNGDKAVAPTDVVSLSSQALIDWLNADSNGKATILIGRTGNADSVNLLFAGDTNGPETNQLAPPELVVTLVPEPTSLALLGLGTLLVARRRR